MFADLHSAAAPPRLDDVVADAASFTAETPHGAARLRLAAGARHAVDAALALHRCDELLCALQAWSGLPLEWRWEGTDAPPHSTASQQACAQSPHGLLALPWTLLRALPAPDAALATQLQWPTLPAVLAVSRLRVAADELALLEPGGAVVLPDSLVPAWHGLLRAADEPASAGVPVALSSPDAPVLASRGAFPSAAASGDDSRIACEVRLSMPHALAADRLAGWCVDEPLNAGPCASLWQCAPARPLATGRLLPWGDAWALAIEAVA
jgi:hypothetical protein